MPRKKRSPSPIVFDDFDYDCEDELSSNGKSFNESSLDLNLVVLTIFPSQIVIESKGNSNPPIQRNAANARERARMRVLSSAFCRLKTKLPWVPADTKLSKLDTLRLATIYIQQLRANLMSSDQENHQYLTDTSTAAPSLVSTFEKRIIIYVEIVNIYNLLKQQILSMFDNMCVFDCKLQPIVLTLKVGNTIR